MSELEHEVDDEGVDDLDGDLALDVERSETVVGGFTKPPAAGFPGGPVPPKTGGPVKPGYGKRP